MSNEPWADGPSILSVLESWDGAGEPPLPDEQADGLRWAAGAQDGVLSHHTAALDEGKEADLVYRAVELVRGSVDSEQARAELYRFCMDEPVLALVDPLLDELRRRGLANQVRPVATFLIQKASHRGPLKLGISLLSVGGRLEDIGVLKKLARHDEFTLYAAVAGAQLAGPDPTNLWWDMARHVRGWGKIHLVERLVDYAPGKPDLRRWLLEEGCDNSVMPEYLAYACATGGQLHRALEQDNPGPRVLDGACLIMGALLEGGPAMDIDDYEEGLQAVSLLLGHLEKQASFEQLTFVGELEGWLTNPETDWSLREPLGWTAEHRQALLERCRRLLERPQWPEQLRQAYQSDDFALRHRAWTLAPRLGVDLWEEAFTRLQTQESLDPFLYWGLLERGDLARHQRVYDQAELALPLGSMALGPAEKYAAGLEHTCLEFLLQAMTAETYRDRLVATGLRSPGIRCRSLAVGVLEKTVPGPLARAAVEQSLTDEVVPRVKERLQALRRD